MFQLHKIKTNTVSFQNEKQKQKEKKPRNKRRKKNRQLFPSDSNFPFSFSDNFCSCLLCSFQTFLLGIYIHIQVNTKSCSVFSMRVFPYDPASVSWGSLHVNSCKCLRFQLLSRTHRFKMRSSAGRYCLRADGNPNCRTAGHEPTLLVPGHGCTPLREPG